MESLYEAAATSRQAFRQWLQRGTARQADTPPEAVLGMARDVRQRYLPGSSAREVYVFIRKRHEAHNAALCGWGKHRFEALCLANGLRIEHRSFVPKTTVRGDFVFPNRIEGLELSGIDQVWASDICYLFGSHGKLIGYATSLIDLYSRRLLGLNFSITMHAQQTSRAVLQQAFDTRQKNTFDNLIFHSDGGKQYFESNFLNALKKRKILSSMAENCFENAFAEAFNDTLKNHILPEFDLNSFAQLKKIEPFVINTYNYNKPHNSLNRQTPVEFERSILSLQPCQRTLLKIKKIEPNQTNLNQLYLLTSS